MANIFGHGATVIGAELETLIRQVNGEIVSDILKLVNSGSDAFHQKDAKLQIRFGDGFKNIYVDFSLQLVGRMGDEPQNIMFILADVTEQIILHQITEQANSVLVSAIEHTGMYTVVEFETATMKSNDQLKDNYGYSSSEKFSYPDIFNAAEIQTGHQKAVNDAISNRGIYQPNMKSGGGMDLFTGSGHMEGFCTMLMERPYIVSVLTRLLIAVYIKFFLFLSRESFRFG